MPLSNDQVDADNAAFFQRTMTEGKKKSSADFDFYDAALRAREQMRGEGLTPTRDAGGAERFTIAQGLRAACNAREDVIAIVIIQHALLVRMSRIRALLWVIVGLLAYIAIQVTR